MLSRISRVFFCHAKNIHTGQIIAKMTDLRGHVKQEQKEIAELKLKVKQRQEQTNKRNKIIHEKRVKLTQDFKRSQQLWDDAKKKSAANKATIIQSFAASLIQFGDHFKKTKGLEKQEHGIDLKEGFDNTGRLFYNTLNKFNIRQTEIKEGVKTKSKDEFEVVSHQKAEKDGSKDTVAKVVQQGWQAEGKMIVKPKVILYQ